VSIVSIIAIVAIVAIVSIISVVSKIAIVSAASKVVVISAFVAVTSRGGTALIGPVLALGPGGRLQVCAAAVARVYVAPFRTPIRRFAVSVDLVVLVPEGVAGALAVAVHLPRGRLQTSLYGHCGGRHEDDNSRRFHVVSLSVCARA